MTNITNILSKTKKVLINGIDFMEGKEKGEIVLGKEYTIIDFGTLVGQDGEYAVFLTKEDNEHFFFGQQVITEKLKSLSEVLSEEELDELKKHGLPVKFSQKKAEKSKRNYIACEFLL